MRWRDGFSTPLTRIVVRTMGTSRESRAEADDTRSVRGDHTTRCRKLVTMRSTFRGSVPAVESGALCRR
jgi:hypothetical protein